MNRKLRAALLVLPVAVVCGAAVWGGLWYRSRTLTPAALLRRLPSSDALVVYLDFAALRRAGILDRVGGPAVAEEPEYRDFAREIGFDYRQDLDSALLAIAPTGKFLLVRGRFDWKKLRAYTESQNGSCDDSLCRMQGSTPDRRISFFPIQSHLMALAVSNDDSAALRLSSAAGRPEVAVPDAPLWVFIPGSVLQAENSLPAEAREFARGMARAESAVLSFVPDGARFAAKLDVHCRNGADASTLAAQLTRATAALRQMMEQNRQAPAGLGAVLSSGAFRGDGAHVLGYWPIERAYVESLLRGQD